MPADLCCPVHREALRPDGERRLVGAARGEAYPVVEGVPVLLADPGERRDAAERSFSQGSARARPLDFYNRTDDHDGFCRSQLEDIRADMQRWLDASRASGPVLEIGSGKGALQGFGGDYTALDYALTALLRYLRPEHQRVCGSASRLPFRDGAFRFVFTIAALEHVPEAALAFGEIERVLAPGGVAYLAPAWHCVQYNCEGIPVRPYRDLDLSQKLVKATLPLRQNVALKALGTLPGRLARRARWSLRPGPTSLRFERLRPDYETFWMSDSDAASRLDAHEACLFFHSRGYEVLAPGASAARQLLARHHPVVVRKPG
jgi:SAM-dependent methyltransferase